jgi:hypothetical protein
MNFNFGEVLTRAWQIIWKHKVLWIFGILAGCARGGGGGSGGGGNSGYQFNQNDPNPFQNNQITQQFKQFGQWLSENLWIILAIIIVLFLISLFFYFLGIIGKIGLIKGTYKAETGAESLNFGEIFSESLPYFWRVFGLSFLIGLAFLVIFIPFILFGVITAGVGLLCMLPLICILIPVSWVLMVVIEQANAAIVIEDLGMFDGFKRGWGIVKTNIGPMIIMALILVFGGGIVSVIVSLPILFALIPLIPMIISGNFQTSPLWVAGLCFCAYLPVIILLNGILSAYIQSAWTLTYMRLTSPKESAPVIIEANA